MGVFKNDVGRPTNETIKKRRILKALLALLVAGALFTGGYYVNEFISKYDVNKEEKESSINSKIILKETLDEDANAEFNYNNKTYNLSIKTEEEKVSVFLNKKSIYEVFAPVGLGNIYLLDDLLVIHIYSGDVRGQSLVFIDFEGTVVKEIVDITEGNLVLNIGTRDDNISIKNDTITLNMTARTHGETLVYKDNKAIEGTMPYSESVKTKYNITDDTIVDATYEFKYLGNKKFSEMKIVDKITYKEYIESQGLNNENVSIEDAEKIINRVFGEDYASYIFYNGANFNDENYKTFLAIVNSNKNGYKCKDIYNSFSTETGFLEKNGDYSYVCYDEIYDYKEVEKNYKSFFGNKLIPVKKSSNKAYDLATYYDYIKDKNMYSLYYLITGDAGNFPTTFVVDSHKKNNKLHIEVAYVNISSNLSMVSSKDDYYSFDLLDGTEVVLTEKEFQENLKVKQYKDKLEKYEFVFFEEDGLYKFEKIEKIK